MEHFARRPKGLSKRDFEVLYKRGVPKLSCKTGFFPILVHYFFILVYIFYFGSPLVNNYQTIIIYFTEINYDFLCYINLLGV